MKCAACKLPLFNNDKILHHISYYPEKIIPVHKKCHLEIHYSHKFPELKPKKKGTIFYQKSRSKFVTVKIKSSQIEKINSFLQTDIGKLYCNAIDFIREAVREKLLEVNKQNV